MATKKMKLDPTGRFPQQIGPDDEADQKPQDAQAALLERIARLEGQVTGFQTTIAEKDRTITSLMEAPVVKYEAPKTPQKKALPDPVADPEGYAAAVRQDILDQLAGDRQAEEARLNEQQTYNRRLGALWNDFAQENPDYAKNQEAVKLAAQAVVNEVVERGGDAQKYMFSDPKGFSAAVKVKMDKLGMAPKTVGDEDETDTDAGDDDRTMGVFGGIESGGNKAGARQEDKPGSLFDGIKEWQVQTGFHR